MSKDIKIKIVNKVNTIGHIGILCDTTIGKVYVAELCHQGDVDWCGVVAKHPSYCFIDDVGDPVAIWYHDNTYELVEE